VNVLTRNSEASLAGEAPEPTWTAYAGSASPIAIEDTTPNEEGSRLKEALVSVLAALFERSPVLAIALAHVVTWCWRGWKEA